jgi:hypothetical protein
MFASCILRQPWYFLKVLLAVGMEAHGRPLNSHWMFPECSLNVPWMFPEYCFTSTECSLNIHSPLPGRGHVRQRRTLLLLQLWHMRRYIRTRFYHPQVSLCSRKADPKGWSLVHVLVVYENMKTIWTIDIYTQVLHEYYVKTIWTICKLYETCMHSTWKLYENYIKCMYA